jgi:SAM-dependent methyltransferase
VPAKSQEYWQARSGQLGSTWYDDPALNAWQHALLWGAVHRMESEWHWLGRKDRRARVLDVGCGDGLWAQRMATDFGAWVVGADLFEYRPVSHSWSVKLVYGVDAEAIDKDPLIAQLGPYDAVFLCGLLEGVANWRRALAAAMQMAPRIVLVEDLRKKVPSYQQNLAHKTPVPWRELGVFVGRKNWRIVDWAAATILDRALYVRLPHRLKTLGAALSGTLDAGLTAAWPHCPCARFRVCYLKAELGVLENLY